MHSWRLLSSASSCSYSSLMNMEAMGSSETSVNLYQTTRCHIQEDSNLHSHHCENFKSCILVCTIMAAHNEFLTHIYYFSKVHYRANKKFPDHWLSTTQKAAHRMYRSVGYTNINYDLHEVLVINLGLFKNFCL